MTDKLDNSKIRLGEKPAPGKETENVFDLFIADCGPVVEFFQDFTPQPPIDLINELEEQMRKVQQIKLLDEETGKVEAAIEGKFTNFEHGVDEEGCPTITGTFKPAVK